MKLLDLSARSSQAKTQDAMMPSNLILANAKKNIYQFTSPWPTVDPTFKGALWRRDPKVGHASATGDIGTHAFHLANYVTGLPITDLQAEFHVRGAPKNKEDTAFMNIRLGAISIRNSQSRHEGRGLPKRLIEISTAADGARGVKFIEVAADSRGAGGQWTIVLNRSLRVTAVV